MGYGRLFTSLLAIMTFHALADISVDRAIIEFEPDGEYYTDINVLNGSSDKAYVGISVYEVINPGRVDESRRPLIDPDNALLIATPSRMALEGNQSNPVRLLNLDEEQKKERIYRVIVEPATGRLKGDQDMVKVLVSYELLVIVRPVKPVFSILGKREGKTLTLFNDGNSNVYLESGRQCNPAKTSECQKLEGERIYAGASWQLQLPWEGEVEFVMNTQDESTIKKIFNGKDTLPKYAPTPQKSQ
ncbi:hypothetical protein [Parendozoicomonas sp. Alg238-R29]|uniref:fimbrial biogenesis chaperone n=1 Tax=Parendozoicomonas sp. Alg238-R29 TaxID=2993446 RepID=UPI00248DC11A|nr:hypothetical protein [Parendozoicomonas sp. Alg238-R29]